MKKHANFQLKIHQKHKNAHYLRPFTPIFYRMEIAFRHGSKGVVSTQPLCNFGLYMIGSVELTSYSLYVFVSNKGGQFN